MFFMSTISYLGKKRWEGRDKIISMMFFIPNPCTSDFWQNILLMRQVFSAHSTDDTLDPESDLAQWSIKGWPEPVSFGVLTRLSNLAPLPLLHVSPCSQQGFVLPYWCWRPSILLPASPQFDGCSILTHTGGFSLKVSLSGSCVNWRIPNRSTLPSGLCILSWRDCLWDNTVNIH